MVAPSLRLVGANGEQSRPPLLPEGHLVKNCNPTFRQPFANLSPDSEDFFAKQELPSLAPPARIEI